MWRDVQSLWLDRFDPSMLIRVVKKYMRKGFRILDTNMRLLVLDDCFEAVTVDGINIIILILERDLDIDDQVLDSANVLGYSAIAEREQSKRSNHQTILGL